MVDRRLQRIIYICFLISGAAGLIYEVVWARQLSLFLGITTYANTAVITAYMAGLAAGSLVIGRLADRHGDSLRLYAWLEVGVGLYAATTPWLLTWMHAAYAGAAGSLGVTGTVSHLLRFALALLLLLVPTFLMGGTLPLLVRGLTSSFPDLAGVTGRLYGINTLGATLGTWAAGYLLLPGFGVRSTIFLGVLMNLGVAAAILALRRRIAPAEIATGKDDKPPSPGKRVRRTAPEVDVLSPAVARALLIGFTISGFGALVYEIAWIRALTLIIGSSVYAFSTTLTTYLAGIALGSLLYARYLAGGEGRRPAKTAGHRPSTGSSYRLAQAAVLEVGIGLSAALGLPLIGLLPGLFLRGYQAGLHESFPLFQAFIFVLCFLLMFLPTLLLGALFPLLTSLWTRDAAAVGRGVGTAYAANTGGTILGALLGGVLLLPALGVQTSLLLAAGLHVAVGAAFWLMRPEQLKGPLRYGAAIAALLLFGLAAWLVPPWDRALMTTGVFVNAPRLAASQPGQTLRERAHERRLLYYAEGMDGVVSVTDTGEQRLLVINGKADASSKRDLPTQVLLGQLPILMHPDPQEVLVIGLGSGITVGSAATHGSIGRIDVLEISPEVVAASRFFAAEHGDVLSDSRVNLIVADARNFLLAETQTYSVITSEPSNPWISGVSNLFTRDFFKLARSRLAPKGIMAQWLQTYSMSVEDVKTVLHTFQTIFPHVSVWVPMRGDLILIGTNEPQALDYARLEEALTLEEIRVDLARVGMDSPQKFLRKFLLGGRELASYTAGAPLNTDDRPRIEFNAPRNLYANTSFVNQVSIVEHLGGAESPVPVVEMAAATPDGLKAPALGLAVRTKAAPAEGDWQTSWLVERQLLPTKKKGNPRVVVASHALLAWQEGEVETRVFAFHLPAQPTSAEQRALVEWLAGRPIRTGKVKLPDGNKRTWLMTDGKTQGQRVLAITWGLPSESGFYIQYVALRSLENPGKKDWRTAISDLARRFRHLE